MDIIILNDTIMISESEMQDICIAVSELSYERDRDIGLAFWIIPHSNMSGTIFKAWPFCIYYEDIIINSRCG